MRLRALHAVSALALGLLSTLTHAETVRVTVPVSEAGELDLPELVSRLAQQTGLAVDRPSGSVGLPVTGLSGGLSRTMLTTTLGPGASVAVNGRSLVLTVDPMPPRAEWERRVRELAAHSEREAVRRLRYGMHARQSYRPNDATRPTVCLVHGMNSSSGGFVHMIPPLEAAGFGVVVYDYPFNRGLAETGELFARDWAACRRGRGEARPWAVVAHSMGALVARSYVEGPAYAGDVSGLLLVAPVNQGSRLARTQTLLQFVDGLQAVGGPRPSANALAHLGDGLGASASDMVPGSPYLRRLNARPRREGVSYAVLAGDSGLIPRETRRRIEAQLQAARAQAGVLGGLVRFAAGSEWTEQLDEVSDGTGDGCVSVASTRLDGVTDHVTMHANHAELIRAPLLFADPGPVACLPFLMERLPRPEARGSGR